MSNLEGLLRIFEAEYSKIVKGMSSKEIDNYLHSYEAIHNYPNFDWGLAKIIEDGFRNQAAGIVKVCIDEYGCCNPFGDEIKDIDKFYEDTLAGLRDGSLNYGYNTVVSYYGSGNFSINIDFD